MNSAAQAQVRHEVPSLARLRPVIEARRRLRSRSTGRAWINGREVGGTDPRYAHLGRSFD